MWNIFYSNCGSGETNKTGSNRQFAARCTTCTGTIPKNVFFFFIPIDTTRRIMSIGLKHWRRSSETHVKVKSHRTCPFRTPHHDEIWHRARPWLLCSARNFKMKGQLKKYIVSQLLLNMQLYQNISLSLDSFFRKKKKKNEHNSILTWLFLKKKKKKKNEHNSSNLGPFTNMG